jgi:hypothetical protein
MSDDRNIAIARITHKMKEHGIAYWMNPKTYYDQMAFVARVEVIHHKKLLAAGFTNDGFDAYTAPPGFKEEDGKRLWEESLEEAKA